MNEKDAGIKRLQSPDAKSEKCKDCLYCIEEMPDCSDCDYCPECWTEIIGKNGRVFCPNCKKYLLEKENE